MNRIAGRAFITLVIALMLVAGLAAFLGEYAVHADDWVIFEGSPHVYNGENIGCGRVVDRDGQLLLDMNGSRTYSANPDLRAATVHWLGDRSGSVSAPALPHYAAQIAGYSFLSGVYRYGSTSGTAAVTLSAKAQQAALEAMGDYRGTAAVYNYKTGELLCAVTTPAFDPDHVPEIDESVPGAYEGIYVNRFTQGLYTPGSIFKIVTLAAALEEIPDIRQQHFVCDGRLELEDGAVTCKDAHWEQSLQKAFRNSCNCVFAQIAQQLGPETLEKYVKKFGITDTVSFDGVQTAGGNFEAVGAGAANLGWAGIGQYHDLINPCAYLRFLGAIASGGKGPEPYIIEKITVGRRNTYTSSVRWNERIMSRETAETLQAYLRYNVENKYGDDNFPGFTVCAKTGTGEVGENRRPNAMFAGFTADEAYPFAFIVCVEDGGYGQRVCVPIASKILEACK